MKMKKKLLLFAVCATAPFAVAVPVSALTSTPGTGCPYDAATCIPAPPTTTPTTTTPTTHPTPQPQPGSGVQVCTVYSNGTVKCEKLRPLQG